MRRARGDRWVRFPAVETGDAQRRLFCFPYAGGSAAIFDDWLRGSDAELEAVAVELPGRADRFAEPAYQDLPSLTAELQEVLAAHMDRPYALYGHSMGANIAYSLAVKIAGQADLPPPVGLYVGARAAPGTTLVGSVNHGSPDEELVDWLRRLGGTPEQFLTDPDLLDVLLPTLRADLAVAAGRMDGVLSVPVRAFAGSVDYEAPPALMRGWAAITSAEFELREIVGGHFFLAHAGWEVLAVIRADLLGA